MCSECLQHSVVSQVLNVLWQPVSCVSAVGGCVGAAWATCVGAVGGCVGAAWATCVSAVGNLCECSAGGVSLSGCAAGGGEIRWVTVDLLEGWSRLASWGGHCSRGDGQWPRGVLAGIKG